MAVKMVQGICAIERQDGAAFLEPKGSCKYSDLRSARDGHDVLAKALEVARRLLPVLAAQIDAKGLSQHMTAGGRSRLHS